MEGSTWSGIMFKGFLICVASICAEFVCWPGFHLVNSLLICENSVYSTLTYSLTLKRLIQDCMESCISRCLLCVQGLIFNRPLDRMFWNKKQHEGGL